MSIFSQIGIGDIEAARQWFGSRCTLTFYNIYSAAEDPLMPNDPNYPYCIPLLSMDEDGTIAVDVCGVSKYGIYGVGWNTPKLTLDYHGYDRLPIHMRLVHPEKTGLVLGNMTGSLTVGKDSEANPPLDLTNAPHECDSLNIRIPIHTPSVITGGPFTVYRDAVIYTSGADCDFELKLIPNTLMTTQSVTFDGDVSRLKISGGGFIFSQAVTGSEPTELYRRAAEGAVVGNMIENLDAISYIENFIKGMPGVGGIEINSSVSLLRTDYIGGSQWRLVDTPDMWHHLL